MERQRDSRGRFVKKQAEEAKEEVRETVKIGLDPKTGNINCPFTDVGSGSGGLCIGVTPLGTIQCDNFELCYPDAEVPDGAE